MVKNCGRSPLALRAPPDACHLPSSVPQLKNYLLAHLFCIVAFIAKLVSKERPVDFSLEDRSSSAVPGCEKI